MPRAVNPESKRQKEIARKERAAREETVSVNYAEIILKRRKARKSLAAYTEAIPLVDDEGNQLRPAKHHIYLLNALERVILGDLKRLMVIMPPGSAKSTYSSVIAPSWALGINPYWTIICASHTTSLAAHFGRRTRNLMMTPEVEAIWGRGTLISGDNKAQDDWSTVDGGYYKAVGVGAAITGRRGDLAIIDDPISGIEAAESITERQKAWNWYKTDLWTRLKAGGRIILILTRWHEDDLAGRLIDDMNKGGESWEIIRLPMEAEENDPIGRKPGERLWSTYFTEEKVKTAKQDPRSWYALYQGQPRPGSGGEFTRECIKYYEADPKTVSEGLNIYICVDSAGSRKRDKNSSNRDYTAVWVIGLGSDRNFYVLDLYRDRLDLTARGKLIMHLHRKWKPREIRYEQYGLAADVEYIYELQERENYRFSITEVGGTEVSKENRIRWLLPVMKDQKRFYFPQTMHRTGSDGVVHELIEEFIEQELLAFPVGRHDDMLDALSRIQQPNMPLIWPKQEDIEDRPGYFRKSGYNQRDSEGASWI